MLISDLLSPERIRCDVQSSSKKQLLELISEELARHSEAFTKREMFESLCARERLGSTGLGNGVAIPHGRIKGSTHVEASFIRLKKPLAFDAIDGQPVDLLFCIAVPEDCGEDHLKLLAQVAEMFSDAAFLEELRKAEDAGTLLQLLSGSRH
jgi:PTS system nitrogen regulatory IIA component